MFSRDLKSGAGRSPAVPADALGRTWGRPFVDGALAALAATVNRRWRGLLCLAAVCLIGCPAASVFAAAPPVDTFAVVRPYPHDPNAFTEGLLYRDGFLFESTGLNGRSSVRKVELATGRVLQQADLASDYFGEGLTDWRGELINLTWQTRIGFVLDLKTFARKRSFDYLGEGWGLAHDSRVIYQSDGSSSLRVLDPVTLRELRRLPVTADGRPIARLNELEWVDGEIFANVWQTDFIARIDPLSGHVVGWIDLTGLLATQAPATQQVDVLNGIAYDAHGKRLFVTGKLWPWLFEIRRVPQSMVRRSAAPPG